MAENSQVATVAVSGTAVNVHWGQWYSTLVIDNYSTVTVFVRTDGTVAGSGVAGDIMVPAGQTMALGNTQPYPTPDLPGTSPYQPGWNAQQNRQPYASTFPTYVSVNATGTPSILVSAQ